MKECPYCRTGIDEAIELEVLEENIETGERRYMCPDCGYEMWE
jgi:uncharacterized protein with PIN domain